MRQLNHLVEDIDVLQQRCLYSHRNNKGFGYECIQVHPREDL